MRLIVILFLLLPYFMYSQPIEEMRGVKLTNVDSDVLSSPSSIAGAMDYLHSIGINAVLPVVFNAGYTQYPSGVMDSLFGGKIDPEFEGWDPLQTLITEAHRVGIEVYPWFEYGFASYYSNNEAPFGGRILDKKPDWALRTSDGDICTKNGFDWMSGINPEVQDFMLKLVEEVLINYDVDGIEFSDRLPALPVEGGYDKATVEIYKAEHNGNKPPTDFKDEQWKRWRADKLNDFYRDVRSLVKSYGEHLFVASSPSYYPWAYHEYLQDPKTWIEDGIIDHFIPQLYRYNISDYIYVLESSLDETAGDNKEITFAGILMNVGDYIASPEFFLDMLAENRRHGLSGEAFFFYEGFHRNGGILGETLKTTYYREPAIVPLRGGNVFRPPAIIVQEGTEYTEIEGKATGVKKMGYEMGIYALTGENASITYSFPVEYAAYYDVFFYLTGDNVFPENGIIELLGNKSNNTAPLFPTKRGWNKIGTVYLEKGKQPAFMVINGGSIIEVDAAMIQINRMKSPNIVIKAK